MATSITGPGRGLRLPGGWLTPVRRAADLSADVVAAALELDTFSSAVSSRLNVPNGMDGAERARYRAVVDKYMTGERTAASEPICRAVAVKLVAGIPHGVPVDVVGGLGLRYSVRVQSQWLGWPTELAEALLEWMTDNHSATRVGDLGTISGWVGSMVSHLAQRPELQRELRSRLADSASEDAAFLDAAIDKLLRIDNLFLFNGSIATRETGLGDHCIEPERRVFLDWVEANRDSAVFGDTEECRRCRKCRLQPRLMGIGIGMGVGQHACPGRSLSTMEIRVDTVELLRQTMAIIPAPGLENARETLPLVGFGSVHVNLAKEQLTLENQSPGSLRARQPAAVGWSSRATKKSDS